MTKNVKKRTREENPLFQVISQVDEIPQSYDEYLESQFKKFHELSDESDSEDKPELPTKATPVWHDSDDESNLFDLQKFNKLKKLQKLGDTQKSIVTASELQERLAAYKNQKTSASAWTQQLKENYINESQPDENQKYGLQSLLKSSTKILSFKNYQLPSEVLQYKCLQDANHFDRFTCAVASCQFVPKSKCFYTTSRDNMLRIFKNAGTKKVKKIKSISFGKTIIKSSAPTILNNEATIVGLCGKRGVFKYNIDTANIHVCKSLQMNRDHNILHKLAIPSVEANVYSVLANQGYILVLDWRTNVLAQKFKMDGLGRTLVMSSEDPCVRMFSGNDHGDIYEWDLRLGKCVRRINDQGSSHVTSMALSSFEDKLAVGSKMGYVNLYDVRKTVTEEAPVRSSVLSIFNKTPVTSEADVIDHFNLSHAFGNLTTLVTQVKFHPSNQILGMASSYAPDALKLVHLNTLTTFKNFPKFDKSMKYPTAFDFNDAGDLLLVGNSHGAIKTFSLSHFTNRGSLQKIASHKQLF